MALVRLAVLPAALALSLACAGPGARTAAVPTAPVGLGEAEAREVLGRFVAASEAGRWDEACGLLSARWRAVYTPGRLAQDRAGAGPVAREAAARVRAALAAGVRFSLVESGRAALPVGPGRAALLVAEGRGWRVDALE